MTAPRFVLVEFLLLESARQIGVRVTPDGSVPLFIEGPICGPTRAVGPWVHFVIDFLVRSKFVDESDRGRIVTDAKVKYSEAGFLWGQHEHNRPTPPLARGSQSN